MFSSIRKAFSCMQCSEFSRDLIRPDTESLIPFHRVKPENGDCCDLEKPLHVLLARAVERTRSLDNLVADEGSYPP